MTEQEAKTKWCPQSFAPEVDGEPNPQFPGHMKGQRYGGFQMRCLGSDCMWWRWTPKAGTDENDQPNYYAGQWQGYCGRAGKP